jgi:amino acid transporter
MLATTLHEPHEVTQAEVVEKAKLKQHFGRFDILFFLICTIVGVDTIGAVASKGATAFTWMIITVVIFFIPSALLFAELGTAIPEEGGPYVWVRLAFGRLAGAVNNFLYWVTNPVWLGGTLAVLAASVFAVFFLGGHAMSSLPWYVFTLVFVWVGVLSAILSFRVGKWFPTVGAWARFLLLGGFTISVIIYAIKNGVHGFGAGDFSIGYAGLIALLPILLFNFVGFELPNAAGDEMKDPQKDVPFSIARSAVASVLLYGLPILGILIVLPKSQVTGLGGFTNAIKTVFTVYGGHVTSSGATLTGAGAFLGGIAAIMFILALLTSGVTWIMGSDRAMAVSAFDGAGPRSLGVISARFGTPVRVNILSGIISTLVLIGAHQIVGGNAAKIFTAVLFLAISTTLVSYVGIFPALAVLRRRLPDLNRPYRAPAPVFLSILLTVLIAFSVIQILMPGLGDVWFGSAYAVTGWTKWGYFWTNLIPLLVFVAVGVLFWALGRDTRQAVAAPAAAPVSEPGSDGEVVLG